MPGAPATDETELGRRMTNFVTTLRQDTYEIYVRLGEAQDERSLMSSRLNLLQRDRCAHAHTALLIEREARLSRGSTTVRDCSLASSRLRSTNTACRDTETDEYTPNTGDSSPELVGTR
ncbi:hypothetical protein Tco_0017554 [Tanacetum coccineum]